ncbi:MAG: transglutaminase family protein [Verrucomicrobiota bacterium]|nr:transglutaminase family protein [Verrucomicrobiota bacterium]
MTMIEHINSLGRAADEVFKKNGVILTQGGEPTFVPENTEAAEWNTAALGPEKIKLGRSLVRCFAEKSYPGALVMQTIGKHYPGEALPRWCLGIYYFKNGQPLWNGLSRFKFDQSKTKQTADPALLVLLAEQLAQHLGLAKEMAQPAFEDVEGQMRFAASKGETVPLPVFHRGKESFVVPDFAHAPDSDKWRTMCTPKGYVLPLDFEAGKWRSEKWTFDLSDEITLVPGESPIGLRLPLSKLPQDTILTALTVQYNDEGDLCIFLPPVKSQAAFLSLTKSLNETVTALKCPPFILEGYPPPSSDEIEKLTVIPDPGVLEINLPPTKNWDEQERFSKLLFHCAEQAGLRPYKYQFSGRKVATGGGSHIILGGPSLEENPFLKCPRLLPSFLRFFQNHPALSFIFTGLFLGPSCQAPRVDESFYDLLYELEISLRAIEAMPAPASPEKIDMILRNLLLDWNGNTHRAEISVDKFYNSYLPNGQLGLIEFRAFEMMPTRELFLAPHLLLRVLAACFIQSPYEGALVDFEHRLHDEFAMPYFLKRNLRSVIAYINEFGFDMREDLFDGIIDFRYPVIEKFSIPGAEFILRQAVESWPVLGEQPTAAGTVARCVDSSTDRLEVFIKAEKAFEFPVLSVNGYRAPLVMQGEHEAVCSIRYRLFDLTHSLQPQVKAHSPLTFELIDRHTGKIVHAFDYLNWKPKASSYDGLPRDEREARERVAERLSICPEKNDQISEPQAFHSHKRAPYTLDLRAVPLIKEK